MLETLFDNDDSEELKYIMVNLEDVMQQTDKLKRNKSPGQDVIHPGLDFRRHLHG